MGELGGKEMVCEDTDLGGKNGKGDYWTRACYLEKKRSVRIQTYVKMIL